MSVQPAAPSASTVAPPPLLRRVSQRLQPFRASVRAKLLFVVLAPLLLGAPVIMALVWYWSNTSYHRLLTYKVGSDLVTANEYFERVILGLGNRVELMARAQQLHSALAKKSPAVVSDELNRARREFHFDFMYVLDAQGRVRYASFARADASDHRAWPVVASALAGSAASQIDIYSNEQLAAIDDSLAERASINIVPTAQAEPDGRISETRGMVVHAAAPIRDAEGRVIGVVEGGMLLNGNLGFVDTINAIVYRDGSLPLGSKGTATLFLGDTRIATNVRLFEGERALGTRVSERVRAHVLDGGKTWLDTAFVVNDWYVSGYEPVVDSFGQRVGMLYVGYLEAPFRNAKTAALAVIFVLFAGISVLGAALCLNWARSVFKPIERIDATISLIDAGHQHARVGEIDGRGGRNDADSRDELGRLAQKFDSLLDSLGEKHQELERWANELDHKVALRTQELEEINAHLVRAQRQLVTSEKLAAIGELTAGVAHEINNPIAVIQGNLDVLREVLGAQAEPVANEIRLIDEQVNRIRVIVTKLLQFARPGEFAGYVEQLDVATVVADCLVLAQHHLSKRGIAVEQKPAHTTKVAINRHELQQVMINLIVNAVQAMPDGGTLTLASADWHEDGRLRGVCVRVRDTGEGIRQEDLARIFDPFFTTKKTQGTGLGLSISYSLLKRYGGRITVHSEPGQGAEFTLWLLGEPEFEVVQGPTAARQLLL